MIAISRLGKLCRNANINKKANLAGQAGPPSRSGLLRKKYYFCTVEQSRMSHDRTYRPVLYAPAPRLRDADGSMRPIPRRSAGYAATETGLSYFGSRYYSSDLSIWLSVDPMSDKYPSLSPYTYCADNPVKLVDPNGEDVWIVGEDGQRYQYKNDGLLYCSNGKVYQGSDAFARSAQSSLKELQGQSTTANKFLGEFVENTSNDIVIKPKQKGGEVCYEPGGSTTIKYENGGTRTTTNGTIYWNPQGESVPTVDGMLQNGTIDLIHEFVHALDKVENAKCKR